MFTPAQIESRLDSLHVAPSEWRASGSVRPAAVLIPMIKRTSGYNLVFTQRSKDLPKHPGQISFPGGSIDAGDAGPAAAALRETREEIGVPEHKVTLLGRVGTAVTPSGFRITSFVGELDPATSFRAEPGEVDEIFEAPFDFFMDPSNHGLRTLTHEGQTRHVIEMPWENRYIWGVTAHILKDLHARLSGGSI